MNDDHHGAYYDASHCITLCTDLVHMVKILKIAYGKSWESLRMSRMRNGEELGLTMSKTSVPIYMC